MILEIIIFHNTVKVMVIVIFITVLLPYYCFHKFFVIFLVLQIIPNMGTCLSILTELLGQQASSPSVDGATSSTAGAISSSSGKTSPIYTSLPEGGAEKFAVRNVYDGDTLTLIDERRVRVIGVDTPEMKPSPEPFAEEAKQFTKSRCHKKEIWLLIDGKDHYGRILGQVFVEQDGGGYLCISEGLIKEGFAYAYTPKMDEKPFNWDKLVAIQREARCAKRGLWKNFNDITVVKTANGSAYHQHSCEHMSNIRNLKELKVSAAADIGLHPCRTCMAN
jgi:endonuclease YncB( thermonuclease family)